MLINHQTYSALNFMIAVVLLVSFGTITSAQNVQESPFIYNRLPVFGQEPLHHFQPNNLKYSNLLTESEEAFLDTVDFGYTRSYIYQEPEFARVRVIRSLIFRMNSYIKFNNQNDFFEDAGKYWNITGVEENAIAIPKKKINTEFHLPFVAREVLGFNINDTLQDSISLSRGFNFYDWRKNDLEFYYDNNYLRQASSGVIVNDYTYEPKQFELIHFEEDIKMALDSGWITGYTGKDFLNELLPQEAMDSLNEKIQGIRFIEDYYIDQFTGKLKSNIMGMGFVGVDTRVDQELLWVYYPEWRWGAKDKCVIVNDFIQQIEYVFSEHKYTGEIERFYRKSVPGDLVDDQDYLVKLDHLVTMQLHKEKLNLKGKNIKIGKRYESGNNLHAIELSSLENDTILYEEFYKNGTLAVKGKLYNFTAEGKFEYYFDTGGIKAERFFEKGLLIGKQKNYYQNGNLYMDYSISDYEVQELTRFYENDSLMEKGSFKNGIYDGKWFFRVQCPKDYYDFLCDKKEIGSFTSYNNMAIEFEAEYKRCGTIQAYRGAPNWYGGGKKFEWVCFKKELIQRKEELID